MRARLALAAALAAGASAGPVAGFEPLGGCFVAEAACPGLSSIRKNENPGDVTTEAGASYRLFGANRSDPSHLQIEVPGASPRQRWVEIGCGRIEPACDVLTGDGPAGEEPGGSDPDASHADNLLAASWQPAFCEIQERRKPECRDQEGRFDAIHFALHGLWPQPRSLAYCGLTARQRERAERAAWGDLPAPELSAATRDRLARVMPGTRSHLDRHEWAKHGTCYGGSAEEYYGESLQLMDELNASQVRDLFQANLGQELSSRQIRDAFTRAFGEGAGERVEIVCDQDGGVTLIGELRIALVGEIKETTTFAELIQAADPVPAGCARGRVDRAGFQF